MCSKTDDWAEEWSASCTELGQNPAHHLRFRLLRELLEGDESVEAIVDFGCSAGELLEELSKDHPAAGLLGIDGNALALERASRTCRKALFVRADLTDLTSVSGSFSDWATHGICCEVLEHLDDPEKALLEFKSILKPRGQLIVTVPGGRMSAIDRFVGHKKHYTCSELESLLTGCGYRVHTVGRYGFPLHNVWTALKHLRGEALLSDVKRAGSKPPWYGRMLLKSFSAGFRRSAGVSRLGINIYAVVSVDSLTSG